MPLDYNRSLIPLAKQLRREMTPQERKLWYDFLRSYPVRFQRQKTIDNYIVDFYCFKARLIVELDGSQHYMEEGMINDAERSGILTSYGLEIIRIANNETYENFCGVCEYIDRIVKERLQ